LEAVNEDGVSWIETLEAALVRWLCHDDDDPLFLLDVEMILIQKKLKDVAQKSD
jgi:hypothetical protein